MLKNILTTSCITTITLLCASCASLKCQHFPGTQEPLTSEQLSDKSVWKYGDEIYHVQVVNSNRLVASSVKWSAESGMHKLNTFEVVPSRLDKTIFLNLKMEEDLYTILRVVPAGEKSVVLLTIDADKVDSDFEKTVIKGVKKGGDRILDCTKAELEAYIRANLNTLFSVDAAGVLELIDGKMQH